MDTLKPDEITEFDRVPDMEGYYISSNAPPSGKFVTLDAYKRTSEWVSVDERLPEYKDVIIKIVHDDNTVMYDIDKYCPSIKEWFYHKDKRITAWAEIPPENTNGK